MNTSTIAVRFDDSSMWVNLTGDSILAVPLVWFPRLLHATAEQRASVQPFSCQPAASLGYSGFRAPWLVELSVKRALYA